MVDLLNLGILVCASVAAMLFGVLTSYAIFRFGFWLLRPEVHPSLVKANTNATIA